MYELDKESPGGFSGESIQQELGRRTGATSVPRVFIDGKFIGGGDDTARLAASGALTKLLA